ncbi:MAG: GNAT family N-acetyltransferase [Bdellovibrionota bacterium]
MKTRFLNNNNLIQVSDLLQIRKSYELNDDVSLLIGNRYQQELTEKSNRLFFLGFGADESPFGYVQLILKNADNDPDLADGVEIAHVHDLRIRKDLQGSGFGQVLMNYLEEEAQMKGIKILTLGVENCNTRALNFYQRLGYVKFKESPGRNDDEVCYLMRKSLV